MSTIVFWLSKPFSDGIISNIVVPECRGFSNDLKGALDFCAELRRDGFDHVTMSSQNPNQIGQNGVSSVEDGKLPDGSSYTWRKRRP